MIERRARPQEVARIGDRLIRIISMLSDKYYCEYLDTGSVSWVPVTEVKLRSTLPKTMQIGVSKYAIKLFTTMKGNPHG